PLAGHPPHAPTPPTPRRYPLTRPGSVGRCTDLSAPGCATDAQCGAGSTCLGGHCTSGVESACSGPGQCPNGAACLGGRCRVAPACIDDANCAPPLPGGPFPLLEPETRWGRHPPTG